MAAGDSVASSAVDAAASWFPVKSPAADAISTDSAAIAFSISSKKQPLNVKLGALLFRNTRKGARKVHQRFLNIGLRIVGRLFS